MKRKELLWMIVPCLLLALFAIALRGRPGATLVLNEPFAVVVEKVEKETLEPGEVGDGWDTKLKITLNHKGPKPKWWGQPVYEAGSNYGARLFYDNDGKQSAIKMLPPGNPLGDHMVWRPRWDEASQRYIARLLLPLAKVPPKDGSVKVQARFDFENNNKQLCPPARLEQVVRRPGEIARVPQVSQNSHLRVENVAIGDAPPAHLSANGYKADTRIVWKLRYDSKGEDTTYLVSEDVLLYDEKGTFHTPNYSEGGSVLSSEKTTSSVVTDFDLKSIPRSAGALTLRGTLRIGSYWPLKINIPIRDKQGRVLKTPPAPAPFTIGAIQVQPLRAKDQKEYGADTAVSIAIRFTGAPPQGLTNPEQWQADWSPHLEDETGKKYRAFSTSRPGGPRRLSFSTSYADSFRGSEAFHSVYYLIPLNQVPSRAKTVKFKTQIGFEHSEQLPVEVLLRKNGVTQFTSQEPW
jgi:hypothetical protein